MTTLQTLNKEERQMAKMPEIKLSVDLNKIAKGIIIADFFDQSQAGALLRFDKAEQCFLINENVLMNIIQLMAPIQEERKLKLVTRDEWLNLGK